MDEEMEEPIVGEGFEIDFIYEFDAPQYYDFTKPETLVEGRDAELWFESATSYPPSPFVLKMNWIYDNPADIASVSCHSRAESMNAAGDDSDNETDYEASAIDDNNRGPELCNDMDQDFPKSKTKPLVKPFLSRSSTLMKPTASYLAKHNQLEEFHFGRFLRSQKLMVKSEKSSQNSSTTENYATKRQKLEAGYLRKVSHLKHQALFLHKVPEKVGVLDVNSVHSRSRVTIPREPNLETAHRAQRNRAKVNSESGEHAKSNACTFKALPLNRKILEAPSLHPPKKSTLRPTEFQLFQLRTSERARQHAINNAAKVHNYDYISQNETRDFRRLNSVDAPKEEKCEAVQKIKTNPGTKKIHSHKEELDVFWNIKKETTDPMGYNFPTDKRILNEAPVELFSKLSLTSEVQTNLKSQSKMPSVTVGSKENAPGSFHLEHEMVKEKSHKFGRNQYQCGSELSDRRITEGGSRFNINRNLDIH
ncbi:protein TPX2-like [Melia azedarach]|uniref:Protein TPX2-like n=1 Tax=Melia azedarach TaxID=155640 RepID=A0ACC1X472_MELAZ|nr:protein TPX2-like [Melia azedarach]